MVNENVIDSLDVLFGINGLLIVVNIVLTIVALTLKKITANASLIILAVALISPLLGALIALFFADDFFDGFGLMFLGVVFGMAVSELLILIYLIVSLAKKKTEPLELME